ncbi:uncharacterized protein [Miscanthus floridulus]|uniref:uncharacterized protein n=1 Tax=Miscanthus floridulus TaxID=154761 RepID=UPI003457B6EF
MEEEAPNKRNEVAILIDHVFILIIQCLTAHTLCSYKCVYHSWNCLISESEYRKELPQIVARFFYRSWKGKRKFISINGEYPSLTSLPFPIKDVVILDCCRGLILCWCVGFYYVVCNPVTNKWWLLPDNNHSFGLARLGFDLIVSSHFHVIEYGKKRAEDYGIDNWTLKHTVTTLEIFGWDNIHFGYDVCDVDYRVIVVHLEWNLIFLVGEDKKLIAYDMNLRKVLVLPTQVVESECI